MSNLRIAKVIIIQQVFNSRKWMELVYPAMVNQTFKDVEIIAQIVEDGGGCEEYIRQNFPQIKILKPGYNIGFAKGHNEIFTSTDCIYYQLVNPDLILEPNYIEEMVKAMDANPQVGASTGKLLQYKFRVKEKTKIIDTTGIIMSRNGRARDRGQHEVDNGQYDNQLQVVGVSGAGPMYRKAALEAIKMPRVLLSSSRRRGPSAALEAARRGVGHEADLDSRLRVRDGLASPVQARVGNDTGERVDDRGRREDDKTQFEYFDEDFHSYWEDTDLSLRMLNAGYEYRFVPSAIGYHGRTAGSSEKGYKDVTAFVKHHKNFSGWVKQLNYKNHMFVVIKNFPNFYWKFFVREFCMLGYIIIFEISTLKILPTLFRQLPLMWKKRKWITEHRKSSDWLKLLNNKGLLS